MGSMCTKSAAKELSETVDFNHFDILRAIGKGTFGKVCIVRKKGADTLYAMKYMNKKMCVEKKAVDNVCREQQILMALKHPFMVNLWYTFQDSEDMFMVVDLYSGGDLQFHIESKNVTFDMHTLRIYTLEIGLALDYLRSKGVVHRDIKPANILLDEQGHLALTDFNVAAIIRKDQGLRNISGTMPFMAPEVFACTIKRAQVYQFSADWWSTGVTLYETYTRKLPFEISSSMRLDDCYRLIKNHHPHLKYPSETWDQEFAEVIQKLLEIQPLDRVQSVDQLMQLSFMKGMNPDQVLQRKVQPNFIPSGKKLNCDPTFELEEMIMEAEPLHKKKKRLQSQNNSASKPETEMDRLFAKFSNFDRDKDWEKSREFGASEMGEHSEAVPLTPAATSIKEEKEDEAEPLYLVKDSLIKGINDNGTIKVDLVSESDKLMSVGTSPAMKETVALREAEEID